MTLKTSGPVVNIDLVGEVHFEDDQLIIGDANVLSLFKANWGGHRQQGRLNLTLELILAETIGVSPSGNGVFAENSEP